MKKDFVKITRTCPNCGNYITSALGQANSNLEMYTCDCRRFCSKNDVELKYYLYGLVLAGFLILAGCLGLLD